MEKTYSLGFDDPAWVVYRHSIARKTGLPRRETVGWWPTLQDAAIAMSRFLIAGSPGATDLILLAATLRQHEATIRAEIDRVLDPAYAVDLSDRPFEAVETV